MRRGRGIRSQKGGTNSRKRKGKRRMISKRKEEQINRGRALENEEDKQNKKTP